MVTTNYKSDFEMDAQLRSFASSLCHAPQAKVSADFTARVMNAIRDESLNTPSRFSWLSFFTVRKCYAAAALILILLGVSSVLYKPSDNKGFENLVAKRLEECSFSASSLAPHLQAFAIQALAKNPNANSAALKAAVEALVASQNADGSWGNAHVTARNVAALADVTSLGIEGVNRAYKRGVRYLRIHNIAMLSKNEMAEETKKALVFICKI